MLIDGEIGTHVAVDDRGLAYGDGLFETLAVVGSRPRFWQGHMDRLALGCKRLGLSMPAQALLLREVQTAAAGYPRCVVKLILTRSPGERGYQPVDQAGCRRIVTVHEWPGKLQELRFKGVRTRVCDTRLAIQPLLGGIKHLNRLEQVLAAREMLAFPGQDGLLLDREDHIISLISANLFLVSGGRLLTPRMDRSGVRGVLRGVILHQFQNRCELRRIGLEMLPEAEEIFACSSVRGIYPVTGIDDQSFEPGPVTRELQAWWNTFAKD